MKKYKKLATDTLLFGFSSFGSKFIYLFLTPLYTSFLTTNQYGLVDLIMTTIEFLYPFLTLGISEAVLRFAFEKGKIRNGTLNTAILFVISSTLILAFCYPFVKNIGSIFDYWKIFVITYFLYNLNLCFSNFIKGLGKTKLIACSGLIQTFIVVFSNIILIVIYKYGLLGYLYSIVIGYSSSIIILFFYGNLYRYLKPICINKSLLISLLKYSLPLIPAIIAWTVNSAVDKYMIIYFCGLSDNGIYSVARKIPTILTTFSGVFLQAWQLTAIDTYSQKNYHIVFSNIYGVFNLFLVGCVIVFIPLIKFIVKLLFAESYFDAWEVVSFLLISALFSALSGFLASVFRATKKTKGLSFSVSIGAIINIIINFFLIQFIGIKGAAIATAISFMVVWIIRFVQVQRFLQIKVNIFNCFFTYAILFILATWYTFELPKFVIAYILLVGIIIIVNKKDIVKLYLSVINIIYQIRNRFKVNGIQ